MRSFETRGDASRPFEESLGCCNGLGILMRERRRVFRPDRFDDAGTAALATGGQSTRRQVRVAGAFAALTDGATGS